MPDTQIKDFHAHIYFDPAEVERARCLGDDVEERFGVAVGHFHLDPVGPHPRGSVQLTVPTELFGDVGTWLAINRAQLTVFAHASTGEVWRDHSHNVVWFGQSEELNLSALG